jgi:putrescine transport system substrate-binding protein
LVVPPALRSSHRECAHLIALPDNYRAPFWFDLLAIPRDAPHPENAHQLINYLMDPQIAANISKAVRYANANVAAAKYLDPVVATDPVIYPTAEEQQRLFPQTEDSPEIARAITRLWQKFKTGQ